MYVTRHQTPARRGVILLVVLSLLTLFAIVGISFVFYADAEAAAARVYREAQDLSRAEVDPELAFSFFLGQLIYDVEDDANGVYSGMRGHSLARSLYGYNTDNDPRTNLPWVNEVPYNGKGRMHYQNTAFNPPVDDYYLVNYSYFPNDPQVPAAQRFLRDPERLGTRTGLNQPRGLFAGGFNVSYTYPDLNNFFLASVTSDGRVLAKSFHRDWLFNPPPLAFNDMTNPNWTNAVGKYLTPRPRPQEHPNFPKPDDAFGDVKNLVGAPGGNDSIWMDLGAPVMTTPDGRKFKMLFAPLIIDLDGKVNVNVHGNVGIIEDNNNNIVSINGHRSNSGWGPTEVNISRVLNGDNATNPQEWRKLFLGNPPAAPPNPGPKTRVFGKYGANFKPSGGGQTPSGHTPHYYMQVDYNALEDTTGNPSPPILLPGSDPVKAPATNRFPYFPPTAYHNGIPQERRGHPLVFNAFRGPAYNAGNDDRVFGPSNLEALLRYGDTGTEFLNSDLLRLCPTNFITSNNASKLRRMVTTHSFDLDRPGLAPWAYSPADPNQALTMQVDLRPNGGGIPLPVGKPIPFPALGQRAASGPPVPPPPLAPPLDPNSNSDFTPDWRAVAASLGRVNLNRNLPPYPHMGSGTVAPYGPPLVTANDRFDDPTKPQVLLQFNAAVTARQQLADDIYRRLLVVTGVAPVNTPNLAAPTDADLAPRRWLAQLAVNIVDFIDEDDVSTPFNFYTAADAGNPAAGFNVGAVSNSDPELPKYWVFGTEMPRVVVNEALAEFPDAKIYSPPDAASTTNSVKVWVELFNTMQVQAALPPGTQGIQGNDLLPINFRRANLLASANTTLPGAQNPYSTYQVVISNGLLDRPVVNGVPVNDNVLGKPATYPPAPAVPRLPIPEDFSTSPTTLGGNPATPVPPQNVSIAPNSYFLIKPASASAPPDFQEPYTTPLPAAMANVPVMSSPKVEYPVTMPHVASMPPDERQTGLAVLLRRLANPNLPFDPRPSLPTGTANPWYNPYVTVDYLDKIPLRSATTGPYASRGKRQPYGGLTVLSTAPGATVYNVDTNNSPVVDQVPVPPLGGGVQHTFGQVNQPSPQVTPTRYDWLVHPDRELISPMELLHVSGYQPHQLTQRFMTGSNAVAAQKFQHYVPWFDEDLAAAPQPQSHRLYRIFEFLSTADRAAGVGTGGRVPGKININTVNDAETLLAICDPPNAGNANNPNFTLANVQALFNQMIKLRSPNLLVNGTYSQQDRPFVGNAAGYSLGPPATDPQYPIQGIDVNDTLLRSSQANGAGTTPRLFQLPQDPAVPSTQHPYMVNELLTKIFNNLTTRSNVFAVWVTVGFFEVENAQAQPPTLGAEIGRSEGRHVRHRMFAIVDRSNVHSYSITSKEGNFVTIPQGQTSVTLDFPVSAVQGTDGNTGKAWRIQKGTLLEIEPNTAREETVVVQNVNANGTIKVTFTKDHPGPNPDPTARFTILHRGNPGPWIRYDPRRDNTVVPYFSIID